MSAITATALRRPSPSRRMGTDEVAAVLGYAQTGTVIRLIREEGLPAIRFNRRYYINEADLRTWMAERGLLDEAAPATTTLPVGPDTTSTVDPAWVAAQVAKFSADDLRRAGELLLALSRAEQSGAA